MAKVRTRGETFEQYVLPETDVLYRVARTLTSQPADADTRPDSDEQATADDNRPLSIGEL